MHPSLRLCSARTHQPLIKFVGKRLWPSTPEPPHAHPAAPAEIKQSFSDFITKFQSSASSPHPAAPAGVKPTPPKTSSGVRIDHVDTYNEFWEAPTRFWEPRSRVLDETEMDAILTGGASLR